MDTGNTQNNKQWERVNPFELKPLKMEKVYNDWQSLYAKPYDKNTADPYTKCRIILANGTEFEAVKHSHELNRTIGNNDIRRALSTVRRSEQQQQKRLACLKPIDESTLEHTIAYEQLAVDLTASIAQAEPDKYVVQALNFALLEDFDHLYRYSNLLEMTEGARAEKLVGGYTEIMPARPTVAHHRHPVDCVRRHVGGNAALITKLHAAIITAAEQQTMNYYMNIAGFAGNITGNAHKPNVITEGGKGHKAKEYADLARRLYQEIGMVEEDHVSQYGSLIDTETSPLACNLMHEYTEAYVYYSCMVSEVDPHIRKIWELHFHQELAHLQQALLLLRNYDHADYQSVVGDGVFPEPLILHENIDYVRKVLRTTVTTTAQKEDYAKVETLPQDNTFFVYQGIVNKNVDRQASHQVIEDHIVAFGSDYRYEVAPNPVKTLRDRKTDNNTLGTGKGSKVMA